MTDAATSVSEGGVTVTSSGAGLLSARNAALAELGGVAAAIVDKDASQWGPEAATEAAGRSSTRR